MRSILFILMFIFIIGTNAHAQLRVLANGKVQTGLFTADDWDTGNQTILQVFGRNGDMRAGSKLSFGDFGKYDSSAWNVFLGEYGTGDSDQLWLHGKSGMYLTSNGKATNIVAYYNPSVNANFVFNTNLRVNGVTVTSDARLKENVRSLQNPLGILNQIDGVTYTYSLSEIQKNRKQDDSKFSEFPQFEADETGSDMQFTTDAAYVAKLNRDKQIQQEIERRDAEEASRKRIGFLAQDIQKVLPELVLTDENGVMSIDYIGFIPLIVESIKEMQQIILYQNEQIENLQNLLSIESTPETRSYVDHTNPWENAKLYNREGASVSYSLPSTFGTAQLQIFDITGKLIKKINIDNFNNIIEISRHEIGYGTFIYALFVDGQKRDVLKKYISR